MTSFNRNIVLRHFIDAFITLALLIVALNFFSIFKHRSEQGFFCDDDSLKYPYKSDTVNERVLYILSLFVPLIIIVIGEGLLQLLQRLRNISQPDPSYVSAFRNFHCNITSFICGFALQMIFVFTAKILLGRLRPHFFDVCQPIRLDGSTCDSQQNHGIYIQHYYCKSKANNQQKILDAVYLSFPSGHASYMFYGMVFVILYLQRFSKSLQQNGIRVGLLMMVVQMFCALLAWFVAVSRVMDYKNHWSDVLVGIVLGTSVAIAVTLFVCQQLKSVNSWPEGVKSYNSDSTLTASSVTIT